MAGPEYARFGVPVEIGGLPEVKNTPVEELSLLPPFSRSFFLDHTVSVAKRLIGTYLVRRAEAALLVGRIVETEAYRQDDPASHSYKGPTDRCRVMFESGGLVYIYRIYGIHECLNFVTEAAGVGCAVLVRAIEPICGLRTLWESRFGEPAPANFPDSRTIGDMSYLARIKSVANGPGKVCQAFDLTRTVHNGLPIDSGTLYVVGDPTDSEPAVEEDRRVGISKGTELRWRFLLAGSPFVSRRSRQ